MFNRFWPKPPEAEGDMQTDDDASAPEEYCRNRTASVNVDEVDEEEEEKQDEDEQGDEE